jgi:MFS family permease
MRLPVSNVKSSKAVPPTYPVRPRVGLAPETCLDQPPSGRERVERTRQDLRSILGDGIAFSLMVGMGETYLPAFVLALGMGQVAAGLIGTIPLLAGAVLQLVSPLAVRRLGSHRRWVVACSLCQAACFVPLCAAAWIGSIPLGALFAVAAVYWGSGLGTNPAWNTWVGTIVPMRLRARYFARRTRLGQIGVVTGFVLAGIGLQYGARVGHLMDVFGVVFLAAGLCRLVSAGFIASQSEPVPPGDDHRRVPLGEFIWRIYVSGEGRVLVYLLSIQTVSQIVGPYFTPYMLRELELSYARYVALIAAAFAAKAISLPWMGALAHRFGARRLLGWGGIAIIPLSSFWIISGNFYYLFCVQIAAGVAWAAYELAMLLLFFETMPAEERTSLLTTYNLANAVATAAGSLLGGAMLLHWGQTRQVYYTLFAISAVGRVLCLVVLRRVPKSSISGDAVATRTVSVGGGAGSLEQPILSSLKAKAKDG